MRLFVLYHNTFMRWQAVASHPYNNIVYKLGLYWRFAPSIGCGYSIAQNSPYSGGELNLFCDAILWQM
jgi:hypothetical protein